MNGLLRLSYGIGGFPMMVATILAANAADPSPSVTDRTVIAADANWIPLPVELDIVKGSALDFSQLDLHDAPAGKHGWLIGRADGEFAFGKETSKARRLRFYGVNLCFGAHYLSREEADRLAERLLRLGYNSVRFHHYERDLIQGMPQSILLNPEKLDQFDYLFHALKQRGIYVSTDLFVSRPVPYAELGMDTPGVVPMDDFKVRVPVQEAAYENWKQFARALLTHVNPHTGLRYADDPALAWLSLINEGNLGNFLSRLRTMPEWNVAWNQWLARKYGSRENLAAAWKDDLKSHEVWGQIALPERLNAPTGRARDGIVFLSETERDMVERMIAFLRDELKCRALITNANSWTYHPTDQAQRALLDFVDDHFYVDHPEFIERSWQLPSRSPNKSPIATGATGGRNRSFTRLFDRPFTISEYNYAGPGQFREVGGILTGALGSLQGWAGLWRFSYSHSRAAMFEPARMGYFDVVTDPLNQAAERASICLFLRGDMQEATPTVSIAMTTLDLANPPERIPALAPRWHWMAWVCQVGTRVIPGPGQRLPREGLGMPWLEHVRLPLGWHDAPAQDRAAGNVVSLNPYTADDAALLSMLRERGILSAQNPTDPARSIFQSATGEIFIDGPANRILFDTPRTAGGFATAGTTLRAPKGGVEIALEGTDATVWVTALERGDIRSSRRLLVTHLTDLQNTGITYAEPERRTLLEWGRLPHLVRDGSATVRIEVDRPIRYSVYSLSTAGRRLELMRKRVAGDSLEFTARVSGGRDGAARMLYEVVWE